jgi:predicted  nucleic acid-binding Zn-ribbon protein
LLNKIDQLNDTIKNLNDEGGGNDKAIRELKEKNKELEEQVFEMKKELREIGIAF